MVVPKKVCCLKSLEKISEYYNDDFKLFISQNQERTFVILDSDEKAVKLKGVGFWISYDCIDIVE